MNMNNIIYCKPIISQIKRRYLTNQKPCVLWFTGLSGSGKSTLANAVEEKLYNNGNLTYLLDGDNIRNGLNKDLGFSNKDRTENIRRVGEVVKLFTDAGLIVLVSFISPFKSDREFVRNILKKGEFIEIFVDTPIEVCEKRDPKGLYKKARKGEIKDFTGVSSPYEKPENPEIHIKNMSVEDSVKKIMNYLVEKRYIRVKS